MKVIGLAAYPVGRDLQIASGPAAIRPNTVIVERAEDHVLHPATIPVKTVTSGINNTVVATNDSSSRTDRVLTSSVGKEDLPNGREGIRSFSIAWKLPLLSSRFAGHATPLRKIGSIAIQLISIDGIVHSILCPEAEIRILRVLNDRRT